MAILGLLPNPNWPQQPLPPRLDRQYTAITAENAQGLFPPDACIFVGNLKITLEDKDLVRDIQQRFSTFGPCHVKVKRDKRKIPTAFVQFEKVEHAVAALAENDLIKLHDRWLRIEKIKGKRTARLGHRSGHPVSPHDFETALTGRGHFESCFLEEVIFLDLGLLTTVFTVTFAYIDDYRDAIKAFERDPIYYLQPLDIEGNPTFSWVLQQPSGPSPSFRRSRSKEARDIMRGQGRSRVPLPAEFQPKTGNGKTVEDYAREINKLPRFGLSEDLVLDVVEELEAEQRHKCLREEWTESSSSGTGATPAPTTDNNSTTPNDSSAGCTDGDGSTSNSRSHSKDSSNTASAPTTTDFESLIESTSTSTTTFTSYLEVVPECVGESSRGRRSRSRSVSVSAGSPARLRLRSCSSSADLPPRKDDIELFFGNGDSHNNNHTTTTTTTTTRRRNHQSRSSSSPPPTLTKRMPRLACNKVPV